MESFKLSGLWFILIFIAALIEKLCANVIARLTCCFYTHDAHTNYIYHTMAQNTSLFCVDHSYTKTI